MWRGLSHEFGAVRLYRTFSLYIVAGETRCAWCLCPSSGWFKHIEPLHYRASKMWRVLTHEFGVVRPYQNFSINSVKGEARCAGCLCTRSGWFKHIEPHRTYTNHTITELARCVETHVTNLYTPSYFCDDVVRVGSLRFAVKQGVQGTYALVRGGSSTLNSCDKPLHTLLLLCCCGSRRFDAVHRTYSNHSITELARCGEVCHMSSGWFDCTEPSLVTDGSVLSNHPERKR